MQKRKEEIVKVNKICLLENFHAIIVCIFRWLATGEDDGKTVRELPVGKHGALLKSKHTHLAYSVSTM